MSAFPPGTSSFERQNIPMVRSDRNDSQVGSQAGKLLGGVTNLPQGFLKTLVLDLSVARNNVEFKISGYAFGFVESYDSATGLPSPNDRIDVVFDDPNLNDPMRFRPFREIVAIVRPFQRILVTNTAQANKTDAFFVYLTGAR